MGNVVISLCPLTTDSNRKQYLAPARSHKSLVRKIVSFSLEIFFYKAPAINMNNCNVKP